MGQHYSSCQNIIMVGSFAASIWTLNPCIFGLGLFVATSVDHQAVVPVSPMPAPTLRMDYRANFQTGGTTPYLVSH